MLPHASKDLQHRIPLPSVKPPISSEGYFICESFGEHTLRGVSQPLHIYRVLGESGASRLDVAQPRGLTPGWSGVGSTPPAGTVGTSRSWARTGGLAEAVTQVLGSPG